MNVEIRTEAAKFPEKEYLNGIFVTVHDGTAWYSETVYKKSEQVVIILIFIARCTGAGHILTFIGSIALQTDASVHYYYKIYNSAN
jgi:hypothetical protein